MDQKCLQNLVESVPSRIKEVLCYVLGSEFEPQKCRKRGSLLGDLFPQIQKGRGGCRRQAGVEDGGSWLTKVENEEAQRLW